ncbi:zonular occludens toxin, partial [Vibrio vulnificus]
KFPPSAKLIRIFTRSEEGVLLWQNWFNWMPIGALIIIDECQDLYSPDVGFKREKAIARPLSDFLPLLPENFSELFHSRWIPCDPENMGDGDTDDTNRTQYDEHGRLLYPFNFYGAFMRHRKYQWDIIMLTPDWTSIPTWLRGCAQEAYSHRSTDTFFRKRRPRIFNHSPKSTKTDPTTKKDEQYVTSKKIPIDVFALYKSTGTGDFNESKSDISIFKSPRFILTMLIAVLAIGNTVRNFVNASSDSDLDS